MAYTPINWQTGDTITAAKLNRCDNGWSVESSSTTYIDNESVTTNDTGEGAALGLVPYAGAITAPVITVTFDGTPYTCAKGEFGYGAVASGPMADFTTYPFGLAADGPVLLLTATAGTYTLTVESSVSTIEVSEDFGKAANACVDTSTMPLLCVSGTTTFAEMSAASASGRLLYFKRNFGTWLITGVSEEVSTTAVSFIPDAGSAMTAGFNSNMVFNVYFT